MNEQDNPMGREYSRAEVAAARRLGMARTEKLLEDGQMVRTLGGTLIWATGPYWPDHARKNARDWALVADAMEREWGDD